MPNDETQAQVQSDAPAPADTAPAPNSEADVQVNNEAPEAPQDVKDPAAEATDTADEKLYAGKYKSVEDLEKSYVDLQSKFGAASNEKAELTKLLSEVFTSPEASPQSSGYEAEDDVEQLDPNVQRLSELERETAVQGFLIAHSQENIDGEALQKVLTDKSDPVLRELKNPKARLEYAYLRSQNMARPTAIAEAEKKAIVAAQAKAAEKQSAQVESAKVSTPVNQEAELMDRIRAGDPAAVNQAIGELPAVQEMKRQAGLL